MKRYIFTLILVLSKFTFGQEVYRTQAGTMVVTGAVMDTTVMLESNKAIIHLNYENASFILRIDKSSFISGNEYFDQLLAEHELEFIVFYGQLNLEFINTEEHAPLDFEIHGNLEGRDEIMEGTGRLEHIAEGGNISCILTMEFNLTIEQLGFDFGEIEVNENIKVEILNAVLSNEWE